MENFDFEPRIGIGPLEEIFDDTQKLQELLQHVREPAVNAGEREKRQGLRCLMADKIKALFLEGRVATGRHLLRASLIDLNFPGDTLRQLLSKERRMRMKKDFHLIGEMCIAHQEACIYFREGYPAEGMRAWGICRGYAEKLKLSLPMDPPPSLIQGAREACLNNAVAIGFAEEMRGGKYIPLKIPSDVRNGILCAHALNDRSDLILLQSLLQSSSREDSPTQHYYRECLELIKQCLEAGRSEVRET